MRESVFYQQILEEGQEEKARQIALKMLSVGFPIPEIARLTDLSPVTIEELRSGDGNDDN